MSSPEQESVGEAAEGSPARPPLSHGAARGLMLLLALLVAVSDQWTKALITATFAVGDSVRVLGPVMSFTRRTNTGGAFGLFQDRTEFLAVIGAVVVAALFIIGPRLAHFNRLALGGLGLVLGGAVGNLIDRFRLGHVEDFIDFHFWPVFNVADIGITVGAGLVLLAILQEGRAERCAD